MEVREGHFVLRLSLHSVSVSLRCDAPESVPLRVLIVVRFAGVVFSLHFVLRLIVGYVQRARGVDERSGNLRRTPCEIKGWVLCCSAESAFAVL